MGIDAYGWVEVKNGFGWWLPVVQAWPLLDRSRNLFGSLFWSDNRTNFKPIVPERGLPDDCSTQVKTEFAELATNCNEESPEVYYSCTWITLREIQAIDWEEEAPVEPYHIWVVERGEEGRIQTHEEVYQRSQLLQKFALSEEALDAAWKSGQKWVVDGKQYQILRPLDKRKEALTAGWQTLFKVMEVLAQQYGAYGVRLVVWFA
jgi:hypothetical protein